MTHGSILFIYPPISKMERYSSKIGSAGGEQIPLGIFYLAAFMREKGWEVAIIDGEAEAITPETIIARIAEIKPDFIGISTTTVAFHRALETATLTKEKYPSIPIIQGGPHVSSNPEHAMAYKEFDFGVIGEGEQTLYELVQTFFKKQSPHSILGLTYRNDEQKLVINNPRPYINNLDALPFPAFDLIDDIEVYAPPPSNYKSKPVVNIITSRGCPGGCTFCDKNVFGNRFRSRSAENIVREIEYLWERYRVKELAFVDDSFLVSKKRVYELFELLDQKGLHFYWTCMARINDVNEKFLRFLKEHGCWHISFGIESGDEGVLRQINKHVSLDRVKEVIRTCRKLKIKTKGFFMIGHPTETQETIDKTIAFACSLPLDDMVTTINTPIPGSPQYREANQFGTLDQTDWTQFNYWRPVFIPTGLDQRTLLNKHQEMYRRFYLRPRQLARYFFSFFGTGGLKRLKSVFGASKFLFKRKIAAL